MPYNKNQFRKVNDKKVLHKVKSHWVAVSLSLLMALGGTAVAGQSVHADNNADLNNLNNVDNQVGASANEGPQIDFDNNVIPTQQASTSPAHVETVTPPYVQDTAKSIVASHLYSGNDINSVIASLKAKPNVGSSASASNSIPSNIVPNSSKASNSVSNSPASSSAASVNYVSGDNGSAASYHAKASADQSLYQINHSLVNKYINVINARFGTQTASLNGNYNSLEAKYKQDRSNADVYFKIANNDNYNQAVSSLAAQHDQTASDYVQSVSYQASSFANHVSQGNSLKSQMAVVNSYAQLINNLHSNSSLRTEYKLKEESASGAFGIASLASSGAAAVSNAIDQQLSFAGQNSFNATMGSINNYYQNLASQFNSSRDGSTLNSLASQLGYNDDYVARSYINSFAASNFGSSNNGTMILKGANGIDHYVNYGSSAVSNVSNDVYTLLSDTSVMDAYGSKSASYRNVISSAAAVKNSASSSVSSAVSASQSASNRYSAASSAFKLYSTLNNPNLNLANIFGTTVPNVNAIAQLSSSNVEQSAAKIVSNNAQSAINSLIGVPVVGPLFATGASSLEPIINVAASAFFSGEASLHSQANLTSLATDMDQNISATVNDLKAKVAGMENNSALENNIKTDGISFSSLASDKLFSGEPLENDIINALAQSNLSIPASVAKVLFNNGGKIFNNLANNIINSSLGNQVVRTVENSNPEVIDNLLDPNSYAAASNAISVYDGNELNNISDNASAISSVAASAVSAANSDAAVSSEYNTSSDVATALAGDLLGSYDNAVYNDQKSLSAAQNSLTSFYDQYAPNYANASAKASSASAAAPVDAQLAQAYGIHVYNYAPKYITAIRDVSLYNSLDGNNESLARVDRGQQLTVNGVGFSKNGDPSYAVTYHGQNGYVTADSNATKNTFLFATNDNKVTITAVRQLSEYSSPVFSKDKRVKSIPVGQKLSGTVVSEDNTYGGFTRIRLNDGNYITANTSWIDIDLNNNSGDNSNNHNNSNVTPQHKVNFD